MLETHPHAHRHPPAQQTKRFETHHVRRIPVTLTDAAREVIDQATRQGRIFPQALSEFFGTLPEVEHVEVGLTAENRLMIDVKHGEDEEKHYRFFVGVDDLHATPRNPREGFDAAQKADELLRLYRRDVLKEGGKPHG